MKAQGLELGQSCCVPRMKLKLLKLLAVWKGAGGAPLPVGLGGGCGARRERQDRRGAGVGFGGRGPEIMAHKNSYAFYESPGLQESAFTAVVDCKMHMDFKRMKCL